MQRTIRAAAAVLTAAAVLMAGCQDEALQTVARLDEAPGNLTVTPEGRILFSLHQHYQPDVRVAELRSATTWRPFPNAQWNDQASPPALNSVLGIQADARGRVWMLDNAMRGGTTPKLVAWDVDAGQLHRTIELPPPATVEGSFLNDLAVDLDHQAIYISDPAQARTAALVVVDLTTGAVRRLLQGHESVVPEEIDMVVQGRLTRIRHDSGAVIRPRVGVNPIALDAANEWLYFGPMSGTSLYRVRTRDLLDRTLSEAELARRVERYARKPLCDGIAIDTAGNIYITEIGFSAIGVIRPDRSYIRLFRDEELLSWPDSLSYGPDGWMYVVANQLHRGPVLNAGDDISQPPYRILRFRPLAPGTVGR